MRQGYKIVDADLHVVEPVDLWERYMEPEFKEHAPKGLNRHLRDLGVKVGDVTYPVPYPTYWTWIPPVMDAEKDIYHEPEQRFWDNVSQVSAMDREGIDTAVLFPSRGLFVLGIDNIPPTVATAISRAYNNWIADFCKPFSPRMYAIAMVAPHDIAGAVQEARRAVLELGLKGVFIRPNPVNSRNWHDSYYDPLYAEAERLGVPVCFHEGGRVHLPQPGANFATHMLCHTTSHSLSMMLAAVDVVGGGVLARFPKLKVAFLEGNCSWVPWLMWRLDEHYEITGSHEHAELTMKPSEYFRRQAYVSVECDEVTAKIMTDFGYDDNVVFSTDYPHKDSKYPKAVESFLSLPFSPETKRKYLWENGMRLYGFDSQCSHHAPRDVSPQANVRTAALAQ